MQSKYQLIARGAKTRKKPVYYVRFRGPDGELLPWKSTGQTSERAARRWAQKYIEKGLLPGNDKITLAELSRRVWAWDSDYVKGLRARGRQIGQSYVKIQAANMDNHVLPTLGSKRVVKLTHNDVERWQLAKLEEEKLSRRTINHCLSALKVVLRHAVDRGIIGESPADRVTKLPEHPEERGILTPAEARQVLDPKHWNRTDAWLINVLAAATGARMAELQAMRIKRVHEQYLEIAESWERRYGFKEPKWGSKRKVPLASGVHKALEEWIDGLEDKSPDALVFPGQDASRPVSPHGISRPLYRAMSAAGIGKEDREKRRLGFHSWRHYFVSRLRTAGLADGQVQALSGHSTVQMLTAYSHFDTTDFLPAAELLEKEIGASR